MNAHYYAGINNHLFNQVPANAKKIFEIGCGFGNFGELYKRHNPEACYYAMEINPDAAKVAATKLDHVFCGSIESSALVDDQFDCIIFGDVLEHLYNPLEALSKVRSMLKPGGCVLCSVPNVQHHTIIASLLAGDFQYQDMGLMDRTHIRFFTYASFIKLLLDAGFLPEIVDVIDLPPAPAFFQALKSGLALLKQDAELARDYLSAYQFIFKGTPNAAFDRAEAPSFPISFVVPTNDRRVLRDNFGSSPIFRSPHPHQLITLEHQPSAALAMENGISLAEHDFVVFLHQDVYLPRKWDAAFCHNVKEAQRAIGNAEMFGVYGLRGGIGAATKHGHVIDRHWHLNFSTSLPAVVDSLDELLIGFRKDSFPGAENSLGYHLYGTDIACRYRERGKSAVAIDAPCFHNSGLGLNLPPEFYDGIPYLKTKWREYLPLVTSCCTIHPD